MSRKTKNMRWKYKKIPGQYLNRGIVWCRKSRVSGAQYVHGAPNHEFRVYSLYMKPQITSFGCTVCTWSHKSQVLSVQYVHEATNHEFRVYSLYMKPQITSFGCTVCTWSHKSRVSGAQFYNVYHGKAQFLLTLEWRGNWYQWCVVWCQWLNAGAVKITEFHYFTIYKIFTCCMRILIWKHSQWVHYLFN